MNKKTTIALSIIILTVMLILALWKLKNRQSSNLPCSSPSVRQVFRPPADIPGGPLDNISQFRYGVRVGRVLVPNYRFNNEKQWKNRIEFSVNPVSFNSDGFRDMEWGKDYRPRIALLGDQFIEGVEVPDDQTMARVMGAIMDTGVMNVGLRGFGTASEILAYQDYVRKFKPSLTVLVFYYNDIYENSGEIQDTLFNNAGINNYLPAFYRESSGNVVLKTHKTATPVPHYDEVKDAPGLKNAKSEDVKARIDFYFKMKGSALFPPRNELLENAWKYTEYAIRMLKDEIEADGGRLLIVPAMTRNIYEYAYAGDADEHGRKRIGYVSMRLREMAGQNGINYYDPMPDSDNYLKSNNVVSPYVYYDSTDLMNPLGHFLIANLTAKYILEKDLISMSVSEKKQITEKINSNLNLSPEVILGEENFNRIYVQTPGKNFHKKNGNQQKR